MGIAIPTPFGHFHPTNNPHVLFQGSCFNYFKINQLYLNYRAPGFFLNLHFPLLRIIFRPSVHKHETNL